MRSKVTSARLKREISRVGLLMANCPGVETLLAEMHGLGVTVVYAADIGQPWDGLYDPQTRTVTVAVCRVTRGGRIAARPAHEILDNLAHECRHAWQHATGRYPRVFTEANPPKRDERRCENDAERFAAEYTYFHLPETAPHPSLREPYPEEHLGGYRAA